VAPAAAVAPPSAPGGFSSPKTKFGADPKIPAINSADWRRLSDDDIDVSFKAKGICPFSSLEFKERRFVPRRGVDWSLTNIERVFQEHSNEEFSGSNPDPGPANPT
jgi:hypothetical protein